jgi:REP element-mobilizing transposase RayT
MPSRNTIKQYEVPAFYHVYNRGAGGQKIFKDTADRYKFLQILERHLSPSYLAQHPETVYEVYKVELVAYCLMGNHFHLLLYQENEPGEISALMRSVSTAYAMYFNREYKSQGHLFQSIFRARHISNEAYFMHITRYIHLNPQTYRTYKWSSLPHYTGKTVNDWVRPERVLTMTVGQYEQFLHDYEDHRQLLKEIGDLLAI